MVENTHSDGRIPRPVRSGSAKFSDDDRRITVGNRRNAYDIIPSNKVFDEVAEGG